jgi:hypothetical protein
MLKYCATTLIPTLGICLACNSTLAVLDVQIATPAVYPFVSLGLGLRDCRLRGGAKSNMAFAESALLMLAMF